MKNARKMGILGMALLVSAILAGCLSVPQGGGNGYTSQTAAEDVLDKPGDFTYDLDSEGTGAIITGLKNKPYRNFCIVIPETIEDFPVTGIGFNAFGDCKNLVAAELPPTVQFIEKFAFEGTGLRSIVIPPSVTELGEGMSNYYLGEDLAPLGTFENCKQLEQVTLPKTLTMIGLQTFRNCTALKQITIPASVRRIGVAAFKGCTSLTSVTFQPSSSYKEIAGGAFAGCTKLETVDFGENESIRFLENSIWVKDRGKHAFDGCTALSLKTKAYLKQHGYERADSGIVNKEHDRSKFHTVDDSCKWLSFDRVEQNRYMNFPRLCYPDDQELWILRFSFGEQPTNDVYVYFDTEKAAREKFRALVKDDPKTAREIIDNYIEEKDRAICCMFDSREYEDENGDVIMIYEYCYKGSDLDRSGMNYSLTF